VHEDIISAFDLNETEAFASIEPLDRTKNSFRHGAFCLLGADSALMLAAFPVVGFIEPNQPELQTLRPPAFDFQTERACKLCDSLS
jgi:hypothetical protein